MTDGSTVMWCCTIVVTDVDHIANTNLPIYQSTYIMHIPMTELYCLHSLQNIRIVEVF